MVHGARGKGWGWLWATCALSAACEGDKPAPGVEYDPNLVEEAGLTEPPRPPLVGGGGRADAGTEAEEDAAAGASDAGLEGGPLDDAQLSDAGAQPEPGALESAERLLVADGLQQRVYAYDVTSRRLLESFALGARALVYAGPSGRYGYALPTAGRDIRIVDMGFMQPTEQGGVQRLEPVGLLDARVSGAGPATLLAHADWVALFFEGGARLDVLRESSLSAEQGELETQSVSPGAAHRGFGLPFDGGFLATRVEAGSQLTLGRYAEDGTLEREVSYECDAPQGVALAGGVLAVGCEAGVLRLEPGGAARVIAYPDAGGEPGLRVGRLVGHPSETLYLTLLGGDNLCVVGASALTCQPLTELTLDFGFDASGKRALVLGSDGILRVFAAEDLRPLGMLRVTGAVLSTDPLVQPRLASGRRITYVSDPDAASVHMVDPATLKLAGRLELPGTPASLAVFGFH